jgi:hypothetical protein
VLPREAARPLVPPPAMAMARPSTPALAAARPMAAAPAPTPAASPPSPMVAMATAPASPTLNEAPASDVPTAAAAPAPATTRSSHHGKEHGKMSPIRATAKKVMARIKPAKRLQPAGHAPAASDSRRSGVREGGLVDPFGKEE